MGAYRRTVRGAEAGAIAAVTLELSFFLLDLVQLQPLATPGVLAGVLPGPNMFVLDLTSSSGLVDAFWAAYQIGVLTAVHFVTFGLVGVVVSLAFDWRQPLEAKRLLLLAALCSLAFFLTVSISSSMVALGSVGWLLVLATNLLAAVTLGASLRLMSMKEPGDQVELAGAA